MIIGLNVVTLLLVFFMYRRLNTTTALIASNQVAIHKSILEVQKQLAKLEDK